MPKDVAIIDLSNARVKKLAIDAIKAATGLHWWTLTRCRAQRSLSQNAFLWAAVYPAVTAGIRQAWGEASFSVDDCHKFCKARFLSRPVVNHDTGEEQGRVVRSTTELDKAEFSAYIDQIAQFASEYLNTEIPPASDYCGTAATTTPSQPRSVAGAATGAE